MKHFLKSNFDDDDDDHDDDDDDDDDILQHIQPKFRQFTCGCIELNFIIFSVV